MCIKPEALVAPNKAYRSSRTAVKTFSIPVTTAVPLDVRQVRAHPRDRLAGPEFKVTPLSANRRDKRTDEGEATGTVGKRGNEGATE